MDDSENERVAGQTEAELHDLELENMRILVLQLKNENNDIKNSFETKLHFSQEKNLILVDANENFENSLNMKCQQLEDMKYDLNAMKDKYETLSNTLQAQNLEIEVQNDEQFQSQKKFEKACKILENEVQCMKDLNLDLELSIRSLQEQQKNEISKFQILLNEKDIKFAELQKVNYDLVLYQKWIELQNTFEEDSKKSVEMIDVELNSNNKSRNETNFDNSSDFADDNSTDDDSKHMEHNTFGFGRQKTLSAIKLGSIDMLLYDKQSSFNREFDSDIESVITPFMMQNNYIFSSDIDFEIESDRESLLLIKDKKHENRFWSNFESMFDRYRIDKCLKTLEKENRELIVSIMAENMMECQRSKMLEESVVKWKKKYGRNVRRLCLEIYSLHYKQC